MMRLFAYYLLGLFLGGFLVFESARAETIPAQVGYAWSVATGGCPGSGTADSLDSAWSAVASTLNSTSSCTGHGTYVYSYNGVPGQICYSHNGGPLVCYSPSQVTVTTFYTCPSGGYTLSGTSCTRPACSSGQVRDGSGACVTPTQCGSGQVYDAVSNTCVCPAAGSNAMIGGAKAWGIAGDSLACTSGGATFGGCAMSCTGGVSASGQASCTGCTFTGQEAPRNPDGSLRADTARPVGSSPPPTPTVQNLKDHCMAQNKGFIETNGVVTCLNAVDSPTPVTTTHQQTTTTTTGGTTTSASTSTSTTCQGGNCSNVTTTTDGQGNTTSRTTNAPASTWCESNPADPVCQGFRDECSKNPDRAGCKNLGEPVSGDVIGEKVIGVTAITVAPMGGNGTCPAPVKFAHGATFSYQPICDALGWLRPLVLALAWLAAGGIVMGVFRHG